MKNIQNLKIHRNKNLFDEKVFIIAEAGVNHNGRLETALELIDAAANSGADAVKFQTFKAEQVVTKKGNLADYQKKNIGKYLSQKEMLKNLELPEKYYPEIIKRCFKNNIRFLSTPHGGQKSVDFLESIGLSIYKIASGDLTNYILLSRVAQTKKPIILSSGMSTLEEIQESVKFLKKEGSGPISILHCTTNYPCSFEEVNLLAMVTIMKKLKLPVGYSDHTMGTEAAIMSVTLGAKIYECHLTLDKNSNGPDHIASVSPNELKERISSIHKTEIMKGNGKKVPTMHERNLVKLIRKGLVANSNLKIGHKLSFNDISAKRPQKGISPIFFQKLIGRTLQRDIKKDHYFCFRDFIKK